MNSSGTGKTLLCSVIIEAVKKLQVTTPSARIKYAYFYCRNENPKKNNLLSIVGALITQLAEQNRDSELSSLLYKMITRSNDAHLSSQNEAKELLKCVLEGSSASHTFLIIDGLDECVTPDDIINVIATINELTEPLNIVSPGTYRLFFSSTDENIIQNQLLKAVKLEIQPKDNEQDIKHYITCWSSKIQKRFGLSDDEHQGLVSSVMSKTNGIYTPSASVSFENTLNQSTFDY